jgi:DNA-binding response OmpR family regulator
LRMLSGYEKTPVIYVTLHSDFQTRAKTLLSGGTDLIAKPVLPMELAVKVLMGLLRPQTRPPLV